jgi:hypothetical protein
MLKQIILISIITYTGKSSSTSDSRQYRNQREYEIKQNLSNEQENRRKTYKGATTK